MARYWMMKCEPSVYNIQDLKNEPTQTIGWEGVRNYQARNMLRDDMKVGDYAFFYYSNAKVPGIAGTMKIVRAGYPDPGAFIPGHRYYDSKSNPDNPRWYQVDVKLVKILDAFIPLSALRQHPELTDLWILRKGNRLSITPLTAFQWDTILDIDL